MAKPVQFERAEHPTATNGQCPICYSEGYADAEKALEAQLLASTEERDRLDNINRDLWSLLNEEQRDAVLERRLALQLATKAEALLQRAVQGLDAICKLLDVQHPGDDDGISGCPACSANKAARALLADLQELG